MWHHILVFLKAIGLCILFSIIVIFAKNLIFKPFYINVLHIQNEKIYLGLTNTLFQVIIFYIICRFLLHQPLLTGDTFKKLIIGCFIASGILLISLLILKISGQLELQAIPSSISAFNIATAIVFFLVLALFEEIVFRGLLYGFIRSHYSGMFTIISVTVLFVLLHLNNKELGILPLVSLIIGGLLLNLLREISQDIWMPLGFHFIWNLFQGVLGFNVSGDNEITPMMRLTSVSQIAGGKFGLEASLPAVLLLSLIVISIILKWQLEAK